MMAILVVYRTAGVSRVIVVTDRETTSKMIDERASESICQIFAV